METGRAVEAGQTIGEEGMTGEARLTMAEVIRYVQQRYGFPLNRSSIWRWMDNYKLPYCQPGGGGCQRLFRVYDIDKLFAKLPAKDQ